MILLDSSVLIEMFRVKNKEKTLFFKLTQKECLLSKKTVLLRQSQSRNIIHDVALEFPQVRIYDPIDIFCNASNCYPMRKGVMLYRDDDHISVDASKIIITDMRQKKLIP
jgi:hypothetical protein